MKIVLAGRYGIGVRVLELLLDAGHDVPAVVTAPSDLERTWQPSLAEAAAAAGVPVLVANINAAAGDIRALGPDLILSVQHPDLFKREILNLPTSGCINLHFGRLPEYGGCYPVIWPILNGDAQAGATLHYMDDGFDSGAVIGIRLVAIDPDDTARQLYDRVAEAALALVRDELPHIAAGTVTATPQRPGAGRYYAKSSIDFAQARFIDWHRPVRQVHDCIRAFTFPPFQLPAVRAAGRVLEFWDARIGSAAPDANPGTVLGLSDRRLVISAGDGTIAIARFRQDDGSPLAPDEVLQQGWLTVGQRLSV